MAERHFIVGEALSNGAGQVPKYLKIRVPPSRRKKGEPITREYEIGDEVVLGPEDDGINVDMLVRNGALIPVSPKAAKTPKPGIEVTSDG